jgi:hypothetical protein
MTGTGALERLIRRPDTSPPAPGLACELCGQAVGPGHRHLLDTSRGELLCVCYPCSVLFHRGEASEGHYRLVPDRRIRLTGVSLRALGVPVGLAFFIRQADGSVVAHYPSPAGATQWEVDPAAWEGAVRDCPELAGLAVGVEALLANTTRGRREAWLVPVDDCHRLVAIVRQNWKGLSGGDRVWPAIERFFDELRRHDGPDPGG